ncbi:hypothetical protein GCM10009623_17010 [Nocardioides aestuarii]|uniref:DUF732 domain-containing protein n=1 Tax=Nocardioides aestuarii TaxID=252231 RepID=A0ABW4TMA6_9ACTN
MRLWLCCLLVLLGPALSACIEHEPAPAPAASYDEAALAEGLAAMYAGDHPDAEDRREGACFAEELLGSTMPAALQSGGLLDGDGRVAAEVPVLDADLAEPVADAQLACTDFVADATAAQVSITKGDLDRAAYARCLRDALPPDAIRAGVVASLQGLWEDPALSAITDAQAGCAQQ